MRVEHGFYAVLDDTIPLDSLNAYNEPLMDELDTNPFIDYFDLFPGEIESVDIPEPVFPDQAVVIRYTVWWDGTQVDMTVFVQFAVVEEPTPVERTTWGAIKRRYR